jgi:hypothetical protein
VVQRIVVLPRLLSSIARRRFPPSSLKHSWARCRNLSSIHNRSPLSEVGRAGQLSLFDRIAKCTTHYEVMVVFRENEEWFNMVYITYAANKICHIEGGSLARIPYHDSIS